MSQDRAFMMGLFEARIPGDRLYTENHLWMQADERGYRVGFTSYSVRLLQDVYFLDWTVDQNTQVGGKQEIGEIESSKALSTLYSPADGKILEFNELLLDDPSTINTDNYGKGWLYRLETEATLLTADQYLELLEGVWDETQRLLKGQLG